MGSPRTHGRGGDLPIHRTVHTDQGFEVHNTLDRRKFFAPIDDVSTVEEALKEFDNLLKR